METAGLVPWLRLARAAIDFPRKLELAGALAPPPGAGVDPPAGMGTEEAAAFGDSALDCRVDNDLETLSRLDGVVLTLADDRYPGLLRQIPRPPLLLVVRGRPALLSTPQVAVVGSRNASHAALETAYQFAAALAEAGLTVTSGLALGIDGAAHRGSLASGGATIGVAATGPERIYPAAHVDLAHEMIDSGSAVITEFLPGDPPKPHHFPRRNRIIAGLSLGTLVVEAAVRSGSLITARHAAEQGREVFAIPGSIHNPAARGCHRLLRDGAKLVECLDDILEELPSVPVNDAKSPSSAFESESGEPGGAAGRVLAAVDDAPTGFDTVVRRTGMAPQEVASVLLELELQAWVCKSAGFFTRRRQRGRASPAPSMPRT